MKLKKEKINKVCSVFECEGMAVNIRGWCNKHYHRWKRHGDPEKTLHRKICSIESCGKPHKSKGYCGFHLTKYITFTSKEKCSVKSCSNAHYGLGYCRTHWTRFKSHGDTSLTKMQFMKKNGLYQKPNFELLLDSYHENTDIKDECWMWDGPVHRGYGQVQYRGTRRIVHRESYKYFIGEIPDGLFCCHKCDRPGCFNPNHLFLGTAKDNMQDCVQKGRFNATKHGEDNFHSKLKENEVILIKEMIANGFKNTEIASIFNVTHGNISCIRLNQTWKHLK